MRIVHLCLCGPITDDWNYQENILTKYHKKSGHDVTIITSEWAWDESGNLKTVENNNYINSDEVRIIRLRLKGRNSFDKKFKRYTNVYKTLEKCKPDIIFIHGCQFLDIKIVKRYLDRNKSVRVYVDNHADFSNSATNWISKNILHKIVWRKCAKIIEPYVEKFYGVLPARVEFLIDMYKIDKSKVELLVMGADDEKVYKYMDKKKCLNLRNELNIREDDFLIVTGGKIDSAKKQTISLMKAIKDTNYNIKLILFGSIAPELKAEVSELVDNKKIYYVGWLNSDESYQYFAIANLVVFPGRHSVFWEQVAGMGIPMIVKYWNGTDHIDIGGNCKFIYKDSVQEIKNIIEEIYNDKNIYYNMQYISKNKAKKKFLYSNIAKQSIGE